MKPWQREEITRISIADVRRRFKPMRFSTLTRVWLQHGVHRVEVELEMHECPTAYGGQRRYFRCPRCSGRAETLGCHVVLGWGCSAKNCSGGWRGRGNYFPKPEEEEPTNLERPPGHLVTPGLMGERESAAEGRSIT